MKHKPTPEQPRQARLLVGRVGRRRRMLEGTTSSKVYVRKAGDAYRIAGTRVSLDSVVYLYREGISPEGMVESYPALTLEQVHGALAYYLANSKKIDAHLGKSEEAAAREHQKSRRANAELIAKLQRARHANQIPG